MGVGSGCSPTPPPTQTPGLSWVSTSMILTLWSNDKIMLVDTSSLVKSYSRSLSG